MELYCATFARLELTLQGIVTRLVCADICVMDNMVYMGTVNNSDQTWHVCSVPAINNK